MALASGCGDSVRSPSASETAIDGGVSEVVVPEGDAGLRGEPMSADAGTATDAASSSDATLPEDSAIPDATPSDAVVSMPAEAGKPDGSTPVFVACTATKDFTVNVASGTSGCTFELAGAPSQPTYLNVLLDGAGLYQRMADGFFYEPGKLTLDGEACDQVSDKQAHVIEITLFCK